MNGVLSIIKANTIYIAGLMIVTLTVFFVLAAFPQLVEHISHLGIMLIKWAHETITNFGFPFSEKPFNPITLYWVFTILVGHIFLEYFIKPSDQKFPNYAMYLLAAYIPGYLILVAINRIVTFILPNHLAFPCLGLTYLVVLILGIMLKGRKWRKARLHHQPNLNNILKKAAQTIAVIFVIVMVLEGFLLNQRMGDIGDGNNIYYEAINNHQAFSSFEHFPIVTRHYDEILYLYPVVESQSYFPFIESPPYDTTYYGLKDTTYFGQKGMIFWYWMMYAYGKAACFSILFLSVYALSQSRLLGLLIPLLLFFGGIHPNPHDYFIMFDAGNPIKNNFHVGRTFMCVLPIAIMAIASLPYSVANIRSKWSFVLIGLMSIGLSALCINYLFLIFASLAMTLFASTSINISIIICVIGFSLLSAISLYAVPPPPVGTGILFIIIGCSVIAWVSVRHIMNAPAKYLSLNPAMIAILVFIFSTVISLCFLGNVFVDAIYKIVPFFHPNFLYRAEAKPPFSFGKNPICGREHCGDLYLFIKQLGLPFILSGVGASLASYVSLKNPIDKKNHSMLLALSFMMTMFILSLFVYDFMDAIPSGVSTNDYSYWMGVWVKSRLPEPWFYGASAISIVMIWNLSNRTGKFLTAGILLAYIFPTYFLL